MSDKCEWKDGKFYPCDSFDPAANHVGNNHYVAHCQGCQTDIDKPEPEVIIHKSGGTYSAVISNKHCICMMPDVYEHLKGKVTPERMLEDGIFKPISEIEITDEIAKLRPMVVNNMEGNIFKLYGVWDEATDNFRYIGYGCSDMTLYQDVRLATVSDLDKNNAGGAS